jgi:hypothetical protein
MMTNEDTEYREEQLIHRVAPFNTKLHIIISSDVQEAARRRTFLKAACVGDSMLAYTAVLNDGSAYVVLPEMVKPATIVHESYHAIHHVLEYNNVGSNEEVFAYHLDDLFEVISNFVKQYRKKRRKNVSDKKH